MVRTICQNSIAHVARLQSIDVLRACAALSVIGVSMASFGPHGSFSQGWLPNIYPVLAAGHGVPLFFVISGFCIHLRWAKQYAQTGTATTDFLGFWKRRLFRLYPPYFVMLCLCMAVIFLEILLGINSKAVTSYPHPRGLWAGIDFLMHALMLHGLSPRFDFSAGNDPFWSLAREEYFYLMYFALLSWRRAAGMLKALLVVLVLGGGHPMGLEVVRIVCQSG
ncbi:MAG TPA: acyltransferase [Armatimonadota bacterium]|nr:acyltransferase [Armatimonadota bacterium]